MESLLFFTKDIADSKEDWVKLKFFLWKPSFNRIVPPNKGRKYLIYWLFHIFGVFKNKNYRSVLVYNGNAIIASLLIVPAYYKWPFMKNEDVQFTYVLTSKKFRGQGLAKRMISFGAQNIDAGNYWYVTDKSNLASIKVAKGMGFKYMGIANRSGVLNKIVLNK